MPSPDRLPSPLYHQTQDWFARACAALLGAVPCAEGCHRCCIGLFPVTLLDRRAIRTGLRQLPDAQRQLITREAEEQVARLTAAAARLNDNPLIDEWPDDDIDVLVERFRDLRCPALRDNGRCAIYDFRPLVCRSMGIPSDDGQTVHGACEVQCFVPVTRLSKSFREEEDRLARKEAAELAAERARAGIPGEEVFLPFAFLSGDEQNDDLDSRIPPVLR